MLVLNLPTTTGELFQPPKARGSWESNDVNLNSLADSLAVPKEAGRSTDLKSIPDVWAQFQGFADAFEFDQHPQHKNAVARWRALLALIALSPEHSMIYELEFRPVKLRTAASGAPSKKFAEILCSLPPQLGLREGFADWYTPVLVFVRKKTGTRLTAAPQLVGLLNPATLIAVGKGADGLRIDGVPWLGDGLIDPTSDDALRKPDSEALNRRDFAILAKFLEELYANLRSSAQGSSNPGDLFNALLGQIDLFHTECAKQAGVLPKNIAEARIADASLLQPPYNLLSKSFKIEVSAEEPSECLISIRPDAAPIGQQPLKGVVLVDGELVGTLGKRANNIRVWKQYFLHEAIQPTVFEAIKSDALREGIIVLKPEQLFTDELVIFEEGAEVSGHSFTNGFRNAVLPLSPLCLLLLDPQSLNGATSLTVSGGGRHTVGIGMTLLDSGKQHVLTKSYAPNNVAGENQVIFDQPRTMGLGIWPDFQEASWRWNFLRFGYDPKSKDLITRFGVSGRYLRSLLDNQEPSQREASVQQLIDGAKCRFTLDGSGNAPRARVTPEGDQSPTHYLRYTSTVNKIEELQASTFAFEAVCFARRRKPGEEAKPSGIVLLHSKLPAMTSGAAVAIDFGTTNTIAYFRGLDGTPEQLVILKERVVVPVIRPKQDQEDRDLEKWAFGDFMPPTQNSTPIPTVAKVPELVTNGDLDLEKIKKEEDDRVLFSSVSFFLPAVAGVTRGAERYRADTTHLERIKGLLRFNLKWRGDTAGRMTASRYLRQKIIMIAAELIDRGYDPRATLWRFSYPEAIPDKELFLRNVAKRLTEVLGPPLRGTDWRGNAEGQQGRLVPCTEANAAAAYFLHEDQTPGQVAIVLDIGGATTDILLHVEGEDVWRTSIQLAGGNFFTNYLYNNPDFFSEGLLLKDLGNIVAAKPPRDLLELIFYDRRFVEQLDNRFEAIAQEQGAGLRHAAIISLAGILFYIGQAARKLIADKQFDLKLFDGMTVALGGRGSEIFRRFNDTEGDRRSKLERVLDVFSLSAGLDVKVYHPGINMSKQPKSEVALGMLRGAVSSDDDDEEAYIPIGESLRVRRAGAIEVISADTDIAALIGTEIDGRPEMPQVDAFFSALEAATGIAVELTDFGRRHVADSLAVSLRKSLADAKKVAEARSASRLQGSVRRPSIEAPFVTALRTIVDIITNPQADRSKFLEIREGR